MEVLVKQNLPHVLKIIVISWLLSTASFYASGQSCNCPAISSCGVCSGGLTSLTLRFDGSVSSTITASDQMGVVYSNIVNPGATFTFNGSIANDKFAGPQIELRINGLLDVAIGSSCAGVFVESTFGSFTVTAGQSKNGGALCCAASSIETVPPAITNCPTNITVALGASACSAVVSWVAPSGSDNCVLESLTSNHLPGETFLPGTTPVTYTAKDIYGNTSTCSFNVIVNDSTDPVITGCTTSITTNLLASECSAIVNWIAPIATDNCSLQSFTSTHVPGDTFLPGTTQVVYTATDIYGNISTCMFTITVNDNTKPVITGCPINITANVPASGCSAVVNWVTPSATDNCSLQSFTSTHLPGNTFLPGTTPVVYTATDIYGNSSTCSFNVTVIDITNPIITNCPVNIVTDLVASACSAAITWPTPSATDNCSLQSFTSTHLPGDSFFPGTTSVVYTATDINGNKTTCSFTVTIRDTTAPEIICPIDITASANTSCEVMVSWTAPLAKDNCSVILTSDHKPGDTFPIGSTSVTYVATDPFGNVATCKFNVTVVDTASPAITDCPSDITVSANSLCEAAVSWTVPIATDNCAAVLTSSHNPGGIFPPGVTVVTYTATDQNGNKVTCTFNVTVNIVGKPTITGCPGSIEVDANENGEAIVTWEDLRASAVCGGVTVSKSHLPGSVFQIGTTPVTYDFKDDNGNSSTCTFNVVVAESEHQFAVANVITPDGDGINDTWVLTNIEKFKSNTVVIIDRWGNKVFDAIGYDNENVLWNGTNKNGALLPTGTYFYTVEVHLLDTIVRKKGFLELIQ